MVKTLIVFVLGLLVNVLGRKTYLVKSEHNLKIQPAVVQATTYDCQKCVLKNDNDYVCVDWSGKWELGWSFYQTQTDDYLYRLRLELYSK